MPDDNTPETQTAERTQSTLSNLQEAPHGNLVVQGVATPDQAVAASLEDKIPVVLGRPGTGVRKYYVPPGTTVEQLCQDVSASLTNQEVWIGEEKVEATHVIQPREAIFLVPRPKNAAQL